MSAYRHLPKIEVEFTAVRRRLRDKLLKIGAYKVGMAATFQWVKETGCAICYGDRLKLEFHADTSSHFARPELDGQSAE